MEASYSLFTIPHSPFLSHPRVPIEGFPLILQPDTQTTPVLEVLSDLKKLRTFTSMFEQFIRKKMIWLLCYLSVTVSSPILSLLC